MWLPQVLRTSLILIGEKACLTGDQPKWRLVVCLQYLQQTEMDDTTTDHTGMSKRSMGHVSNKAGKHALLLILWCTCLFFPFFFCTENSCGLLVFSDRSDAEHRWCKIKTTKCLYMYIKKHAHSAKVHHHTFAYPVTLWVTEWKKITL